MATFEQTSKDGFKGVRRTWLALLNIIFAHAVAHAMDSSITPRSDRTRTFRRTTEAETYYKRAFGLCNEQIVNGKGIGIEVGKSTKILGQGENSDGK
jgi:hypothetical protein